ncbi:MAG TPA: hypothetical protein VF132_07905, partial [Rudaea sp.]
SVAQVSAGNRHSCAALLDGRAVCWGDNSRNELGTSPESYAERPQLVYFRDGTVMDDVRAVGAGTDFSCALRIDGSVYCWGDNSFGEVGSGWGGEFKKLPTQVWLTAAAVSISVGEYHACAVARATSLWCWGRNTWGELGNGNTTDQSSPVQVVVTDGAGHRAPLVGVVKVDAGAGHTCAILSDTSAACWGANGDGKLGDGTAKDKLSPSAVITSDGMGGVVHLTDIATISAGNNHTCAVLSYDLSGACWGSNGNGQLGNPAVAIDATSPVPVAVKAAEISAGGAHSCAILADGRLACWGSNQFGQLGIGPVDGTQSPAFPTARTTAVRISSGDYHTCAVLSDSTVQCWGKGDSGQLGDGYTFDRSMPVDVLAVPVSDRIFFDDFE